MSQNIFLKIFYISLSWYINSLEISKIFKRLFRILELLRISIIFSFFWILKIEIFKQKHPYFGMVTEIFFMIVQHLETEPPDYFSILFVPRYVFLLILLDSSKQLKDSFYNSLIFNSSDEKHLPMK